MRKRFVVTTEVRAYEIDLNEAECEQLRLHYHGYVRIVEVKPLDFKGINEWLNGSK